MACPLWACRRCRCSFLAAFASRLAAFSRRKASLTSSSVSTSFASLISAIGSSTSASSPSPASSRLQPRGLAFGAGEPAAEALAPVDRHVHLDAHQMAGKAVEVRFAHQRPVDAGRGHLQPIGALDQIGDVEHRRERARHGLAILHRHRAVRPLRHDLHGAAVGGRIPSRAPGGSRAARSPARRHRRRAPTGRARRSAAARSQ